MKKRFQYIWCWLVLAAVLGCGENISVDSEPKIKLEPIEFKRSLTQTCHFEGHVDGVINKIKLSPIMTWADLQNAKQLVSFGEGFLAYDSIGLKILEPNEEKTILVWEPLPSESIVSMAVTGNTIYLAVDNAGEFTVRKHQIENGTLNAATNVLSVRDVLSVSVTIDVDGYLIVAVGETKKLAVDSEYANDGKTIQGGILRIDPENPTVPIANNPAYGDAPGLVFATGIRHPAGCVLDSKSQLWCADQGPRFAELHRVRKASKLGWPEFDGSTCALREKCKLLLDRIPQAKFERKDENCGIILGNAYAATEHVALQDTLYFANTCENRVHALLLSSPDRYWWDGPAGVVDGTITGMGGDKNGNVFVLTENGIFEISIENQNTFPKRISESGCFQANGKTMGMIPYSMNAELWTDGAVKDRWIELPPGTMIDTSDPINLIFPKGSVIAKNFSYVIDGKLRVVETRIMVRGEFGWDFHTYRWNEDGSDAILLKEKEDVQLDTTLNEELTQIRHLFPDRANCRMCHASSLQVLGPRLDQMDKTFKIQASEFDGLSLLKDVKYIPEDATAARPIVSYTDTNATIEERARAFLHTNCSHCHRPGGWKPSTLNMDFRYEKSFKDTNTCDVPAVYGAIFTLENRIRPGDAEASVLYQRLTNTGIEKMPPIGRSIVPTQGAAVVKEWIDGLEQCPE